MQMDEIIVKMQLSVLTLGRILQWMVFYISYDVNVYSMLAL